VFTGLWLSWLASSREHSSPCACGCCTRAVRRAAALPCPTYARRQLTAGNVACSPVSPVKAEWRVSSTRSRSGGGREIIDRQMFIWVMRLAFPSKTAHPTPLSTNELSVALAHLSPPPSLLYLAHTVQMKAQADPADGLTVVGCVFQGEQQCRRLGRRALNPRQDKLNNRRNEALI
jgi:hypothetical protein